ncbi:MAG: hypothetical protein O7A03_08060 [Alphaproteobacteria bacterium]|nr:hypothetical protein [Alphaproteobacteria bacterium]
MTKVDLFESLFRSADKPIFVREPPVIANIALVTDLGDSDADALLAQVRSFLAAVDTDTTRWATIGEADFSSVQTLLERIEAVGPDLIVTYRHLKSGAWRWPFSLGEYLDVLTQAISVPVIVLPHPDADHALPHSVRDTDNVMAITDHLAGDNRIVNYALAFTSEGGTCWLTHIESGPSYERYMDAISKIPGIDTETARLEIAAQLLKEPRDFIDRAKVAIQTEKRAVRVEAITAMGRRLDEYKHLIDTHGVDLLVLHTKDEDQLAMHGMAYPLTVEMRQIPLLLL